MEEEVYLQGNSTVYLSQEEEQFSDIDDDSEKSKECATNTQAELCVIKEVDDSENQESPKHSFGPMESSSSFADSNDELESAVIKTESSSLPECPAFQELNLEITANLHELTSDTSEGALPVPLREEQTLLTEAQKTCLKESEDTIKITSEKMSLKNKEVSSKCFKHVKNSDDSNGITSITKHEFVSNLPAVNVEHEQKYNESKCFEQENISAKTDIVPLNVITDPKKEITELTREKKVTEALEENASDRKSSTVSSNEKCTIEKPTFSQEDCSIPGSSYVTQVKENYQIIKSTGSEKGLETSIEEAQEALEEINPDNFADIVNQRMGYQCRQINTSDNGSDYEEVSFNINIASSHITEVLRRMISNHYVAEGNEDDLKMYSYCKYLFEKDYKIKVINNEGGTLCKNYPARIIVPYSNHNHSSALFDPEVYRELTMKSSGARCRDRFIAPTIFWNGKFICRSATLTVKKSAVYETATKSPPPKEFEADPGSGKRILKHVRAKSESFLHRTSKTAQAMFKLIDLDAMKQYREDDKKLLEYCQILHIADLMVEDKKKKFGISVSSSEKIYQESYCGFEILQMPYPGCKFFKRYHEARRIPNGLIFDWSRSDVNAVLKIPNTSNIEFPAREWHRYKEWDVVKITQNYIELILTYFMQGNMGILVHCISGWDRTPLFIALLRISLWADGLIHESLNAHEMAYLTLAYDWYLFGHNLPSRLKHREEIMHFCYKFLEYFIEDQFSATLMWNRTRIKEATPEPHLLPFRPEGRVEKIQQLREIVLKLYDEHVLRIPA